MKYVHQFAVLTLCVVLLICSLILPSGCANRGIGPQGGPIDSLAPVITKMTIPNGSRNVHTKEMYIQFNEYVQINGATDNILVSPPQQHPIEIKAIGKRVEIKFQEDLIDSTTYTIDFGDQIVDNNERNPLHDFAYSFSTGNQIDSLEVYGQLINAEDLNPISGIVVGLHDPNNDSSFYQRPFRRIARTNKEGEFAIRNVKEGTYRIYALQDQSRDYCFQNGEGLAFYDATITPYIITEVVHDTIYLPDTLDVAGSPIADSVITSEYFYYEPSNIILRLFKEDYKRLYFQRALRKDAHLIQLLFNGTQPAVPQLQALRLTSDSIYSDSTWVDFTEHCMVQHNVTMDTFCIWLTDSMAIGNDSIRFAMTYTKTDSLYQPQLQTDTLLMVYRAPRLSERTKKAMQQKREKMGLQLTSNASGAFNYFDTLFIRSNTPIARYEKDSFHLYLKQDSVITPVPFELKQPTAVGTPLMVLTPWSPAKRYQLSLDSGAVTDIYQMTNKAVEYNLSVRSDEEYATMTVFVSPFTDKAVIQILNSQDLPIRTARADAKGTVFNYMEPGTYYMRIFMDNNGDGKWTTGDLHQLRQPEEVYYFHKKLTLRANWIFEEHFDWQAIPLLQQKPAAIRKDLSETKKK